MKDIKIHYNGRYPSLCYGILTVSIDNKSYQMTMSSTGKCYISDNYDEVVEEGPWEINFPANFPVGYKIQVLEKVNNEIPWGCCGGCL